MLKNKRYILILLGFCLSINLCVGFRLFATETEKNGEALGYEKMQVFTKVIRLIRENYVNEKDTTYEHLLYDAMRGMLSSLDRFSAFMTPDEYRNMQEDTQGEFGGLGIYLTQKNHFFTIVTPLEDTPAAAIGLLANDQIVAIESKSTEKMKLTEAIKLLKGKPGTKVTISIYRPSSENTFDVTITRAVIHIKSVKNVSVNEDKIGYIRITQFGAETSTLLAKALNDLDRKGAEALVLDLRNNPGGLLDSAVEVSSLFLPKGKLVVFTEGRDKIQKQEFFSGNGRKHSEYPMAILVNGGSASAAEIVSGCLQDYERAILIGEKTFGKGSVQTVVQLPDYSAIRLTTAKYYTPSKKIIHNHGIEPNIKIEISNEIAVKLAIQRSRPKEMKLPEGEEVIEDVQLKRAFEAIKECKIMNSDRINKYREIVKKYEIKDPKIEEK